MLPHRSTQTGLAVALLVGLTGCEEPRELDDEPLALTTAAATEVVEGAAPPIAEPILRELRDELGAAYHDLEVYSRDGLVELTGVMPTLWHEERALAIAAADPRTRAIVDDLDVTLFAAEDDEIARDVMRSIADEGATEAWDVDVIVYAGHVWVTGVVDSPTEHVMAISAAKKVRGVLGVHDWLLTRVPPDRAGEELRRDALAVLEKNPYIDDDRLWVDVDGGDIAVHGAVTKLGAAAAVAKQLRLLAGVDSIDAAILELPTLPSAPRVDAYDLTIHDTADAARFALTRAELKSPVVVAKEPGVVELRGLVDTIDEATLAARAVASVVGIERVENALAPQTVSAVPKASEVEASLTTVGLAENIEVAMVGRTATLTGEVDNGMQRALAGQVAEGHTGVVDVVNDVTLRTVPAFRTATFD